MGRRTQTSTIDKTWEIFEEAIKRNIPAKPEPVAELKTEASVEKSVEDSTEGTDSTEGIGKKKKKDKKKSKNVNSIENVDNDITAENNVSVESDAQAMEEEEEIVNQGVKMFPGTRAVLNGTKASNGATAIKGDKKKRKKEEGSIDEVSPTKLGCQEPEVEDQSEGDENNPKKFNWEFTVRKLLVKIVIFYTVHPPYRTNTQSMSHR